IQDRIVHTRDGSGGASSKSTCTRYPCTLPPLEEEAAVDTRSWTTAGIGEEARAALFEGLPASEVWSLLLDVLARRAAQRTPPGLLQQWERDGFTHPAPIDQRTLNALDGHLLAAAGAFEALELSPLAPLGVCS